MGITYSQMDNYIKTEEGKEVEEYLVNKVVKQIGYSYYIITNTYFNYEGNTVVYHLMTDNGLTVLIYKTKEDAINLKYRLVEIDTV